MSHKSWKKRYARTTASFSSVGSYHDTRTKSSVSAFQSTIPFLFVFAVEIMCFWFWGQVDHLQLPWRHFCQLLSFLAGGFTQVKALRHSGQTGNYWSFAVCKAHLEVPKINLTDNWKVSCHVHFKRKGQPHVFVCLLWILKAPDPHAQS